MNSNTSLMAWTGGTEGGPGIGTGTTLAGSNSAQNCWDYPYPRAPFAPVVTYWPQSPPISTASVIQTLALLVEAGKISEATFVKCVEALKKS